MTEEKTEVKEAWQESLEILKELAQDLGFDPQTQTFSKLNSPKLIEAFSE